LYGAAEFSRNVDFAVLADDANLERLLTAMQDLEAKVVAIPEFQREHLERGHAVHFRCAHEEAFGVRVDVMTRMRGVDDFELLWARRSTIHWGDLIVDVMSLQDLVQAKKTQRDKDWPIIRRLVERAYYEADDGDDWERARFLLNELRTPELLIATAESHADLAKSLSVKRPALLAALRGDAEETRTALEAEEQRERALDREYWKPLREELERLRREKRLTSP
jgi:hypothetical protein